MAGRWSQGGAAAPLAEWCSTPGWAVAGGGAKKKLGQVEGQRHDSGWAGIGASMSWAGMGLWRRLASLSRALLLIRLDRGRFGFCVNWFVGVKRS